MAIVWALSGFNSKGRHHSSERGSAQRAARSLSPEVVQDCREVGAKEHCASCSPGWLGSCVAAQAIALRLELNRRISSARESWIGASFSRPRLAEQVLRVAL